jgi:hypothetical protein
MMLLLHILIAFSSLGYTAFTYLYPSKKKLNISYIFITLTFITGTYLVFMHPARLVSSCISGSVFLGVSVIGIVFTRLKLARQVNEDTTL